LNTYTRGNNTYNFNMYDYNLIDDIYSSIKDWDRIIFVSRHGERWWDFSKTWWLTRHWIEQAKILWNKLKWGKFSDTSKDFYWSTTFKRTHQTSYYLWLTRWYEPFLNNELPEENREDFNLVYHTIKVVDDGYYWENVETRYAKNRNEGNRKSEIMMNSLCQLTEWHPFSRITTHDVVLIPCLSRLTKEKITFTRNTWINYLSWIAIIVHNNNEYEAYPFRTLKEKSMVLLNW